MLGYGNRNMEINILSSYSDLGVKSYRSFQRAAAAFCGHDFPADVRIPCSPASPVP